MRLAKPLPDIITHIRAVVANPGVSTTLIQTEDLKVLCDAAEARITPKPTETEKFHKFLEKSLGGHEKPRLDLTPRREEMVEAILEQHTQRVLAAYPLTSDVPVESVRKEIATYRPYAERDADAIIVALANG